MTEKQNGCYAPSSPSTERIVETTIVRDNLMTRDGYSPYCGGCDEMPRTKWDGEQFKCSCGWRSKFTDDFVARYKAKWSLK